MVSEDEGELTFVVVFFFILDGTISALDMLQYSNVTVDHLASVLPSLQPFAEDQDIARRLKIEGKVRR